MVTKISDPEYAEKGFCNIAWGNECEDPAGYGINGGVRASEGTGSTTVRCARCDEFCCAGCRVTIDNVLVCLNCAEKRIQGIGTLQADADHTEGLPETAKRTKVLVDGVSHIYLDRECPKSVKHDGHAWTSHWFGYDKDAKDNAYCPGLKKDKFKSTGSGSYTTWVKPKKDYSEDAENFPVSEPITVAQARKIAFDMHKGQKDKSGLPYSSHLHAVCKGVEVLGGSKDERVAALFHDAVEDYHTSYDLLRKINVSEASIKMIEAVSKRTSEEQGKYLARIIAAGPGAMRVKLADLFHNTRHDRIQALRDDKQDYTADRLLKKYRPSIAALMLELGMIVDVDTQKKLATKPIGSASWSSSSYKPKKATGGSKKAPAEEPAEDVMSWKKGEAFPCAAKDLMLGDFVAAIDLWVDDVDSPEDGDVPEGKRGITWSDGSYDVVEENEIFNVVVD